VNKSYDAIVVGTGGVGSAALMHLARRGVRAIGLDRFPPGHDRGSSHGRTRVIRQAYFEHPDYVPLLRRAYELWADLESARDDRLFHRAGLLEVGPADGIVIPGVLESARRYGLNVDELTPEEAARRFPGFVIPDGCRAVFERDAGFLLVERCVVAHLEEAQRLGAELHTGEAVTGWSADGDGVSVETERARYHAAKLVVAGGAWSSTLLGELGVRLRVVRKHQHWFATDDVRYRLDHGCPAFFYELSAAHEMPGNFFYGMPWYDEFGVKFAEHSGHDDDVADPTALDRSPSEEDRRRVEAFLRGHLPGVSTRQIAHAICMYTLTPDEHFLVDRHPRHPQVVFAAGLSGHGFKFTSVLGEVLAELALDGRSTQSIGFLGLHS
jgi:monomeric sarcosine oxidase